MRNHDIYYSWYVYSGKGQDNTSIGNRHKVLFMCPRIRVNKMFGLYIAIYNEYELPMGNF